MLACLYGQQESVTVPSRSRPGEKHTIRRDLQTCSCEAFKFHVEDREGKQWCYHLQHDNDTRCRWTERQFGPPGGPVCPSCGGPLEEERMASSAPIPAAATTREDIERGRVALPGSSLDAVPGEPAGPAHDVGERADAGAAGFRGERPRGPRGAGDQHTPGDIVSNPEYWDALWARFERGNQRER